MARSDSQKDVFASGNEMPLEDFLDGTSARTRPFSYDDIMVRRINKGDKAQQVSSSSGATDIELAHNVEKEANIRESPPRISHNSKPVDESKNSNVSEKGRSGRKPDTSASRKNENLVKDNDDRSLYLDAKSKDKRDRSVRRSTVLEEKFEGRNHSSRKKDDLFNIGGLDKRKDRESYKQDRVSERSRVKSEIVKAQPHKQERQVYRKRKTDEHVTSDSDTEYKNRNLRQTYISTGRGKEKSVKEKKHKHDPEDSKSRGRNSFQMNESERNRSDPTRTHLEESRSKRRKSRSKDREKDRGRRSISLSPKAYKHTSKDKSELAEQSSQSTKDKSGREHSDVDNKRIPSNGSNSQYRRNANTSSGLGGYSPRKRKTDAAAKTPSPTYRSPERRTAGWDLQPIEKESVQATSIISNVNTASQKVSLNIIKYPSTTPLAPVVVKPIGTSLQTISSQMHAVESIQLTQATRPKRRLYVENLPVSVSEKDLIEFINKLMLSSGVNYIQGTRPCISCIIHKEKSQALLEFLTPEDVSAALLLDGMTFSGSNLKLRRPKDYADVTTGLPDKSLGGIESISDIVKDSPNKIFIGGISRFFSSRMVLEIARAFGLVKAFHFEFIGETNEPCAFVEYVDHSVTSKACAGLNGMRLGGQFLTAVLATPEHVSVGESVEELPTYEIPEHAKSLIKKPTTVLKLKNVFNPENLISLSVSELDGIMEDIRLECSRFGMVRFVNVANKTNPCATMEVDEVRNTSACTDAYDFHFANRVEQLRESTSRLTEFEKSEPLEAQKEEVENNSCTLKERNGCDNIAGSSDVLSGSIESEDRNRSKLDGGSLSNEITACNIVKDEVCELPFNGEHVSFDESSSQSSLGNFTEECKNHQSTSDVEMVGNYNNAGSTSVMKFELENKPSTVVDLKSGDQNSRSSDELKIQEGNDSVNVDRKELDAAPREDDRKDIFDDLGHVFEPGSVIIEYRRLEAACMAAHCLHGRTFDGRVVTVEYVAHDLYQMWFCR